MSTTASEEGDPIQEFRLDFWKALNSSLPLKHFSQFYEDKEIRRATDLEMEKILKKILEVNPNQSADIDLLKKRFQHFIDEFVKINEVHKFESETFFKNQVNLICETFFMSSHAKLLINSDVDLKSAEEILVRRKMAAIKYFEDNWNLGNTELFQKHTEELKKKLDQLENDMVENHRLLLEGVKAEKVFENVKAVVLEMSRQIKCYVDTLEGKVPAEVLKERAQDLFDYLAGKGEALSDRYRKVYLHLVGTTMGAMKFLAEMEESMSMSAEDLIAWAHKLDSKLKFYSSVDEADLPDIHDGEQQEDVSESAFENATPDPEMDIDVNADQVSIEQSNSRYSDTMEPSEISEEGDVRVSVHDIPENQEDLECTPSPSPSKRLRRTISEDSSSDDELSDKDADIDLNIPNKGDFPLLWSIRDGRSVAYIKSLLDRGADVNIKKKCATEYNAAHEVIISLIRKTRAPSGAIDVLDLLMSEGFALLNEKYKRSQRKSALSYAMDVKELNEEMLEWFYRNGADFNDCDAKDGESVIFHAITNGQSGGIIRKLVEFGADPKHVTKRNENVLHFAAKAGNLDALEIFVDHFDVNGLDSYWKWTPLHFLFSSPNKDYGRCLEMLLDKGANFGLGPGANSLPLVSWIRSNDGNPFPTLMKLKDSLPITHPIACKALTAMVREAERWCRRLYGLILSDFAKLFKFLFEEKHAKLYMKNESKWKLQNWKNIDKIISTRECSDELARRRVVVWEGDLKRIEPNHFRKLDIITTSSCSVSIPIEIETLLICMLASSEGKAFVRVCKLLDKFCVKF